MRRIFMQSIERDDIAIQFEWLLEMNNGLLTEEDIAESLRITTRQVRIIAELYNFRKYVNCDITKKYQVIDKKYHIITKTHKKRDFTLNKRKWTAIQSLSAYKIYLEDIGGDAEQLSMINDLLDLMEVGDE